jgi:hypothetical protein
MLLEVTAGCYRQDWVLTMLQHLVRMGISKAWRSVRRPGSNDAQDIGRELLAMSRFNMRYDISKLRLVVM